MAGKTRELKTRMKAVGNIQRITKTMQMISTARFQAMQKRAVSAQAYSRKIAEMVADVATAAGTDERFSHPLLSAPEPAAGRELLLVISSNRGLCGGYNANVLRTALSFIREHDRDKLDLQVVGKKGRGYFKFNRIELDAYLEQFGETPEFEDVRKLAEGYMAAFIDGRYDAIRVCYMAFETMSRQSSKIEQLLPMQPPKAKKEAAGLNTGSNVQYEFSPPAEQLLGELLPITLKTRLYQCFNEAVVSEQLARMVAMKAATDAAGKMKKNLGRQYNRARQTAITTELTEIISGAMALE